MNQEETYFVMELHAFYVGRAITQSNMEVPEALTDTFTFLQRRVPILVTLLRLELVRKDLTKYL